MFPCAEAADKSPSFTHALHCSKILNKGMTSSKNFQWRGEEKIGKGIIPGCFSGGCFLCLALNIDNSSEPASPTAPVLEFSYLSVQQR